ncbi:MULTISPECIES: hypothetical protein [unclassified Exiguobacterium]|uniref:hypothetical protein n=1 Tax=unclassified Exiguobacterium TaxID=2644629 RepID=UPI001BEC3A02|nr:MULTISPECIES: hypothetical protein [unclassified Exiguobacterium]
MSFWAWLAIAIVLVTSITVANSQKKSDKKQYAVLVIFLIAVALFLTWWFTK